MSPRANRTTSSAASGFTLIEVVVALAIAGMGLGLLVAATGSGLESSTAAARYLQAIAQAQSRLAQIGLTLPLKKGDYFGEEEGGFRWHVHVAQSLSPSSPGTVALYPVTVTESWKNGRQEKSLSLYSERLGQP